MATAKKTTAKKTTATKATTKRAATTRKGATATASTGSTAASATVTDQGFRLSLGDIQLSDVDVKAVALDSAYASVGAADKAIAVARELPQRLEQLSKARTEDAKARADKAQTLVTEYRGKVESFVKEAPTKLQAELQDGVKAAREEFTAYANRGRTVVESVTKNDQTKKAISQTETARSQVKAAVTSIRKAVEQGQDAVEGAVERIGLRRSA